MVGKRQLEKDIQVLDGIGNAAIRFGELIVYPTHKAPTSVVADVDDMVGTTGHITTEPGYMVVFRYDTNDIEILDD